MCVLHLSCLVTLHIFDHRRVSSYIYHESLAAGCIRAGVGLHHHAWCPARARGLEDHGQRADHRENIPSGLPSPHYAAVDAAALHCAGATCYPSLPLFLINLAG